MKWKTGVLAGAVCGRPECEWRADEENTVDNADWHGTARRAVA